MTRPDRSGRPDRRGFTLIELLVALLVGATVVLGARLLVEGVAADARRLTLFAQRTDREANAERVLRSMVAMVDVSTVGAGPFGGDERQARFTSWCDRPAGWQERCAVTLSIADDSVARALLLTLPGSEPLRVRMGFKHGELRYLSDAHDGGQWLRSWGSGLTVPLAVGAILDADTLVLTIGAGG
jgi:prepilin-type N-terminal cleavage/methylation domain-containing protein